MQKRPSPALVVSIIALVVASSGTAVATVNYARNAGAVDHRSAVTSHATTKVAAGKLVATASSGSAKGRSPAKFLDLHGLIAGEKGTFGRAFEVLDNAPAAPVAIGLVPGLGAVTAT